MKHCEETFSLDEEFQTIYLHCKIAIEKVKKKYRYIRFGLVHVALQPLTTSGLDSAIFMAFRNYRLIRRNYSLLDVIQMRICNGPIYVNYCLNYSVDLNDPWIIDALLLDIRLPNIQNNLTTQFHGLS